jgi:hypothetical protein
MGRNPGHQQEREREGSQRAENSSTTSHSKIASGGVGDD